MILNEIDFSISGKNFYFYPFVTRTMINLLVIKIIISFFVSCNCLSFVLENKIKL